MVIIIAFKLTDDGKKNRVPFNHGNVTPINSKSNHASDCK